MPDEIQFIGLKELQAAVKRNPRVVLNEARNFISRGLAAYKSGIINNPWRIGGQGGGAPVSNDPAYFRRDQRQRSGNLRDSHVTRITGLQGSIGPNISAAPYARFVHEGTRKMEKRPWLDYVKQNKDREIKKLYRTMLGKVADDLAK